MHLKLRGGGFVANNSPKSATWNRQRIHNISPPPSSEQSPTQLQVDGAFASQVQSSVSGTSGYPDTSVEDGFRSTVTASVAAGAVGAAGSASVKSPSKPSPSRTSDQGLSGSIKRSPERQTTAGGDDLGFFGGIGGVGGVGVGVCVGGDGDDGRGGTWNNAAGGIVFPEQDAPALRRAGRDNGSAAGWKSAWDTERESRRLTGDAGSRFPGSSARQDLPSGLNESVERLCAAAFLRGHVPEGLMPKGTTAEEAYQR